jgi:hypothetical protein
MLVGASRGRVYTHNKIYTQLGEFSSYGYMNPREGATTPRSVVIIQTSYHLTSLLLHSIDSQHKMATGQSKADDQKEKQENHRKSSTLRANNSKGKSILNLAKDLVAKKCDFLLDVESLDDMTLQQYINMYKQLLS